MARVVAAAVLEHQFGSTVRKAVALVLADHADGDRWATTVGQQRISREAEVGERTVRRVLAEFEDEGLIRRVRRHRESGARTSDEIVLVQSAIERLPATDAGRQIPPTGQGGRLDGSDQGGTYRPHRPNLPATQAEPTGQGGRGYEPSGEPSVEPDSLRSSRLPATQAGSDLDPPTGQSGRLDGTLVLDQDRSDPQTGLEVWIDDTGKQRRRVDRLWDTAVEIWGRPRTGPESGKRNREIGQLRDAGVSPEELRYAVQRAVVQWRGEARPGLAGIIRNLGDLLEGFDLPGPDAIARARNEAHRSQEARRIAAAMKGNQ